MAFWLARRRNGQDSEWIQRFDPRFWTVNFPRPMMASVVTTAPNALRVDVEFHHKDALAGLIWESEDRYDHPLLGYTADRDYSRTILRFRWRSSGVIALDQVNGPVLTIEGRDVNGNPTSWYVRLWNYAVGTAQDAQITLPFSKLTSGWSSSDPASPAVYPGDIDRMFFSIAPPGYVAADHSLLPSRVNGWVELTGIACEGYRPMLEIGDVILPPHGLQISTAYDDAYNVTPARLLRNIRGLGYRGRILHYLGMSHFFRLMPSGNSMLVLPAGALCAPAETWHSSYFALAKAQGFAIVASLSYEILAQHCQFAWQQRTFNGNAALTAWDPPSALLSPASAPAMGWLQSIATRIVAMLKAVNLPVLFQIGEPWWWVKSDGRICLYDNAAKAAFGGDPVNIPDMRASLTIAQTSLLDAAGALLAQSTANLND